MSSNRLNQQGARDLIAAKVDEVINEPDYSWKGTFTSFMTEKNGAPVVRASIVNCALDFDLWAGLRSPAKVGMHPLSLEDLWTHYAAMTVKTTREDGRNDPLAMPLGFERARKTYKRAVIVCGMLALNPEVFRIYRDKIEKGDEDPFDYYGRATKETEAIINKAVGKAALALMKPGRAVIPMTDMNVKNIIARARSEYQSGKYHGPCNDHWPHNSMAVMAGLLRFGVSRLPFRDETGEDGKAQRLFGRYRSIVIFDEEPVVEDGAGGVSLLDADRMELLRRVSDYTDVDPGIVEQRYCTYNKVPSGGGSVCGKCIEVCPSQALVNSTVGPDGNFSERLLKQDHRFKDGALDFDHHNCCTDRSRMAQIHEDYVCARCEAICATRGIRKSAPAVSRINGDG